MTNAPYGEPQKPAAGHEARKGQPQPLRPIAGIDDATLAGSGRASRLIGSKVFKGDTSIGKIEDVLVELPHARLTAVILSLGGGFLGIGDKLVAVPASHIMAGSEGRFVTDLTEAQLASAAAFDFSIVDQQFTGVSV